MKTRENLVRLKQFQVNDKRRQLLQLDMMIAEFDRMAGELEIQIAAEEKKAGITDINHFAYPTFAKAARLRRDNLKNSQHDLLQRNRTLAVAPTARADRVYTGVLYDALAGAYPDTIVWVGDLPRLLGTEPTQA